MVHEQMWQGLFFPVSTSLKMKQGVMRIVPGLVSTSLKNETKGMSIVPNLVSSLLKNETRVSRIILLLCQPH